ncbi:MAG: TSCPD domain-containing protein, partial [Muribaculaceae bacterium]|nr:TSCPD domain-containing protein [Muribaculaceae bacterium]
VYMQAMFQKNVDNAISKTCNFNSDATEKDIADTYLHAYQLGCKGVTVYRDGCRDTQVLNAGTKDASKKETPKADMSSIPDLEKELRNIPGAETLLDRVKTNAPEMFNMFVKSLATIYFPEYEGRLVVLDSERSMADDKLDDLCREHLQVLYNTRELDRLFACLPNGMADIIRNAEPVKIRPRPQRLTGDTSQVKVNCGKLYITANKDSSGDLFEVFSTTGKTGGCPAQSEAICRLISLALRAGVPVDAITRQIKGIKCMACMRNPDIKVLSCPDAIAREIIIAAEDKPKEAAVEHKPYTTQEVKYYFESEPEKKSEEEAARPADGTDVCPQCGATMKHIGGCKNCLECGYSSCG